LTIERQFEGMYHPATSRPNHCISKELQNTTSPLLIQEPAMGLCNDSQHSTNSSD